MKIYGDILSPFVRACMVCGHEVGLFDKIELVKTSVKPTEENPDLARLSPIGKIPVLETNHHHAIYDSRVIEYLAHVAGNRDIIPDDGVKRFRVLTLAALATGIADAAVALRYEQAQRPPEKQWAALAERNQQRIVTGIRDANKNWTADLGHVTAATILLATTLTYIDYRHAGIAWRTTNPEVAAFHAWFSNRDSMKAFPLPPA
jgi:glutathione S-transferase